MNMKDFAVGAVAGAVAGAAVVEAVNRADRNVPAEKVLNNVKSAFKKEGPIEGSWIVMKTEPFRQKAVQLDVYRGGLTREIDGVFEEYEFAADAKTGTVVEITKI
ncbi:peptidase M4 [Edaphobacillus lindanitolerans]|uniref:Predicted small secreted protein n=1 Tax=Edaphobacillus lindanitolerans TaxID=550447 RepID=A0A1U7PNQ9_9BACI|nr:peptidase M4 [Edaphobacillus lindanitolerans]SIT85465.1 Predicted small secreted protein [Edaphobacillus lindanitolerans]